MKTMDQICRSCGRAPVEVIEMLDDPVEPYRVCRGCHQRLMSHSLRPAEWYNLSSIHGRLNDYLSEEYYDEKDGRALDPGDEVVEAELFPCPSFEEVASSPKQLLAFILSRSHIHEEGPASEWYIDHSLVAAMQRHPPDALLPVFVEKLSVARNTEIARTVFHLVGLTLGSRGAALVRGNWEEFSRSAAFGGVAFAASRCLPLEEAHARVIDALSRMDEARRSVSKHVLHWFETELNLDWIEENVSAPVDSSWGLLAASSRFDWERAKKWLSLGRPLSLVALDALEWCVCSGRKPPLLNPPNPQEFDSVLMDYLKKDNVRRVKERAHALLEFSQTLRDRTSRLS